jgi:hypothetical protein
MAARSASTVDHKRFPIQLHRAHHVFQQPFRHHWLSPRPANQDAFPFSSTPRHQHVMVKG